MKDLLNNYTFNYNQDNLELICKDIPQETPEKHSSNDFYGQASILKKYAGVDENKPLYFVYEHSVPFITDKVWSQDLNSEYRMICTASEIRNQAYRKMVDKSVKVSTIGSPIYYASKVYETLHPNNIKKRRKGTLVFPAHSTHHIKVNFDIEKYAKTLKKLPEKFQPVVVCMYWKNFLEEQHLPYLELGIPVVSAGHMYDKLFLLRLYELLSQFEYATSNTIGTYLFYSQIVRVKFFYTYLDKIDYENPNNYPIGTSEAYFNIEKKSAELFSYKNVETNLKEKKEFVDLYAGTKYTKNRMAMKKIIFESYIKYKWFYFILPSLREKYWRVTSLIPSSVKKKIKRILSIKN